LLSNALCHTTRGGVLLAARRYQGQIRLQIWDTGSGIAPEHQPRIFEEFYRVGTQKAQTPQGLGLGLAIVRRLARLLGHPLQLHSRVGLGSVFSLDVPVLANGPAYIDSPREKSDTTLKGCAVVVDDDPAVRDALGNLLQQWGMEVVLMHNLYQVMHELQAAPDVVLVDYQLTDSETGLMVAREVHKRWGGNIPIVLITGDTRTETIQALRQSGFPVLHKPVPANQLRALLTRLLRI
jgi:CheY-like chemotaxis protein